jgi:hypothetical protein
MNIEAPISKGSSFAAFIRLRAQMSQSARIGMWAILALGIFLRAFRLDTFEFKGDELEAIMEGLPATAHLWWSEHGMLFLIYFILNPAVHPPHPFADSNSERKSCLTAARNQAPGN